MAPDQSLCVQPFPTQSVEPSMDAELRQKIIAAPELLLEDVELMRTLVDAHGRAMGGNIIDMRGIAMQRLEARLDRLEDTHRSVIAAAYDNLAGTQQVHRAILALLEAPKFDAFLTALEGEVAGILRLDAVRLLLETKEPQADPTLKRFATVLGIVPAGFAQDYLGLSRPSGRVVTLRGLPAGSPLPVYGELSAEIRSEACLRLDLGEGRLPGLLLLGARDANVFSAQQGTDLMVFFTQAFERVMRRWLDT